MNSPSPGPCTRCGYDLSGVPIADAHTTCPECGLSQPVPPPPTATTTPYGWTRPLITLSLLPTTLLVIAWLCDIVGLPSEIGYTILRASVFSFVVGPVCYAIGGAIHAASRGRSVGFPILISFEGFVLGGVCLWLVAMLLASTFGYLT